MGGAQLQGLLHLFQRTTPLGGSACDGAGHRAALTHSKGGRRVAADWVICLLTVQDQRAAEVHRFRI